MRGVGYLVGIVLILAGIGDAITRLTIDGWFLILAGTGFATVLVTYLTDPGVDDA